MRDELEIQHSDFVPFAPPSVGGSWSVSLVSEEYTIILDSYRTDTDARTIMTATGVPWARWNTCTMKIVETSLT